MIRKIFADKPAKLFIFLSAFFVANALIAECIGGKLFSLEALLGLEAKPFSLLGQDGLTYTLTCGVLLWPIEFVMTDIVNEYYGPKAVRRISFIAIGLISYAFLMFYMAIATPPNTAFWTGSQKENGVPDMQLAFSAIFGQGMWIIFGSLVAFLVAQLLDSWVFHKIKQATGEKMVWLRATGSTMVSQLIDSFIVLFIAFYLGPQHWSWQMVLAVGLVNYSYKAVAALVLTPVIYLIHAAIDRYFGKELSLEMRTAAMNKLND
ncbi:MAG TPA: queuosine precursor transporter [Flavipsychrobacter sp.]|nr:queuosine precursor transporter [Flavipsychrobacter sp.]